MIILNEAENDNKYLNDLNRKLRLSKTLLVILFFVIILSSGIFIYDWIKEGEMTSNLLVGIIACTGIFISTYVGRKNILKEFKKRKSDL